MSDSLVMFTIYDRPADQPSHVVVRGFNIRPGLEPIPEPVALLVSTVDAARALIRRARPGLVCLPRDERDDACIVESWV